MKYRVFSIVLLFMLLIAFSVHAMNFAPEQTYGSVVVVYTETGVGSGFYIKENIVITNAHVVERSKKVAVNLYDGTTIEGSVVKIDTDKDLALIRVGKSAPALDINTDSLNIGQEVYAIGAPKDMPYTMTKGIISSLQRELGKNKYIQIDASVNSGNSGGPLMDENGKVIGIITLKASDAEGIGFAITAGDIEEFVAAEDYADTYDEPETTNSDSAVAPENSCGDDSANEELRSENDRLKITVCILAVLNAVLLLICLYLRINGNKKDKDEFDFEIEIKE